MSRILDFLRAWPILLVAVVMLSIAVFMSAISLWVTLYGLSKIAAAGYMGYWIDRLLFPYCRPHQSWWGDEDDEETEPLTDEERELVKDLPVYTPLPQIRRAIIVAACILAAGLIP